MSMAQLRSSACCAWTRFWWASRFPARNAGSSRPAPAAWARPSKVNFLRDLGADTGQLGRSYFPQAGSAGLSAESKDELITDIRADLAAARAVMDQLPLTARVGVIAATDLFEALTNDIAALPALALPTKRVSVSIPRKLALLLRAPVKSLRRTR